MSINVGAFAHDPTRLPVFSRVNRCPKCGGEAGLKHNTLWHWMYGDMAEVMERRCNDCRYWWVERLEA